MIYDIFYNNKRARLFLSKTGESFTASILYYIKHGSWSGEEEIILHFDVKSFLDQDQEDAIEKAKEWFSNNISKDFEFKLTS